MIVDCSTIRLLFSENYGFAVVPGNLVKSFDVWFKEWSVSFEIYLKSTVTQQSQILRIGKNISFMLKANSTQVNVIANVNDEVTSHFVEIHIHEWTTFHVLQQATDNKTRYLYQVEMNGQLMTSMDNDAAREYSNVVVMIVVVLGLSIKTSFVNF